MNIYTKQSQFELFPQRADRPESSPRHRFFFTNLSLSLENLVVAVVVLLMLVVLAFSAGVERGRQLAHEVYQKKLRTLQASVAKAVPAVRSASAPQPRTMNVPVQAVSKGPAVVVRSAVPAAPTAPAVVAPSAPKPAVPVQVQAPAAAPLKEMLEKNEQKGYTIQVASYKGERFAKIEATSLQKKGFEALVLTKGDYAIVCVGKFDQRTDADQFAKKLKKQYKDCLVRSL